MSGVVLSCDTSDFCHAILTIIIFPSNLSASDLSSELTLTVRIYNQGIAIINNF
jgi:hypothetical protein